MKKSIIACLGLLICLICGCTIYGVSHSKAQKDTESYLRIHIRANSNSECDQGVKLEVKKKVVDFLTEKIAAGSTFEEVYAILNDNLSEIEQVADSVLEENGYTYKSKARLNEEYFPSRSYLDVTLNEGYYDALILELGEGKGNNWWCVVYPPLCFIGSEGSNPNNIVYKSKFIEIIRKFFSL